LEITPTLTSKQKTAFKYLYDNKTSEVLFGGAAGGGKSWTGCAWIIILCLQYKGIRCLIGRSKLTNLKKTTMNTFFEVCKQWNINSGEHFTFNAGSSTVTFYNGSEVYLKDLYHYPSDPNYDSLGSLELTAVFVDECNQITEKAKQVLTSRIRYKLDEYGILPKILLTCNPSKNWVYTEFYRPSRMNKLPEYRKFVQSLVTDNPFISKHYEEQLEKLDEISKQRLLHGNWEYDDSDDRLMDYDKLVESFNTKLPEGEKYITADIARFGNDKTVIVLWNGLNAINFWTMDTNTVTEAANKIKEIQMLNEVILRNIIVDEDGIGGGVKDILRCKGFINNGRPLQKGNYRNLKTQCYYLLSDMINKEEVGFDIRDIEVKKKLLQELEQVRRKNIDKDAKLQIIGKDEIKDTIGRSPDYADAVMMRMFYEIRGDGKYYIQ